MIKRYFSVAAVSDVGGGKSTNQDNLLVKIGEDKYGDFGLFIVADGMGGLSYGAIASRIVVNKFGIWWETKFKEILKNYKSDVIKIVNKELNYTVEEANNEVINFSKVVGERVGTTISVLFLYKDSYIIKHIGDSRVYAVSDDLLQLTIDHSWVAREIRYGRLTEKEAKRHPRRNVLTQCIGVSKKIDIYEDYGLINKNEVYFICSDGFYRLIKGNEIQELLRDYSEKKIITLKDVASNLLENVKKRNPKDNISIIIISPEEHSFRKNSIGKVKAAMF
ncbi:MAG: protein phosphatase 2C domain-containing protein [Clostridiales bacterium]